VLTKTDTRLPGDSELQPLGKLKGWLDDEFLSNTVFEGINRLTTRRPRLIPSANKVAARALSERPTSTGRTGSAAPRR
jgi:hypothetical protein